jgi:hypothetical protein
VTVSIIYGIYRIYPLWFRPRAAGLLRWPLLKKKQDERSTMNNDQQAQFLDANNLQTFVSNELMGMINF